MNQSTNIVLNGRTIQAESNLNIFKHYKYNRGYKQSLLRDLKTEIPKTGFIIPMVVAEEADGKYIIDGQHRLEALKRLKEDGVLGIPSEIEFYLLDKAELPSTEQGMQDFIARLNSATSPWTAKQKTELRSNSGDTNFSKVFEFGGSYAFIPENMAISIFKKEYIETRDLHNTDYTGVFTDKNESRFDIVAKQIRKILSSLRLNKSTHLVKGYIKFLLNKKIDYLTDKEVEGICTFLEKTKMALVLSKEDQVLKELPSKTSYASWRDEFADIYSGDIYKEWEIMR